MSSHLAIAFFLSIDQFFSGQLMPRVAFRHHACWQLMRCNHFRTKKNTLYFTRILPHQQCVSFLYLQKYIFRILMDGIQYPKKSDLFREHGFSLITYVLCSTTWLWAWRSRGYVVMWYARCRIDWVCNVLHHWLTRYALPGWRLSCGMQVCDARCYDPPPHVTVRVRPTSDGRSPRVLQPGGVLGS